MVSAACIVPLGTMGLRALPSARSRIRLGGRVTDPEAQLWLRTACSSDLPRISSICRAGMEPVEYWRGGILAWSRHSSTRADDENRATAAPCWTLYWIKG